MLAPLLVAMAFSAAETPNAAEIMRQVAANFERSAPARAQFVYQQRVRAGLSRPGGEVARREKREYLVTPGETTTTKKLTSFSGEYRKGKTLIPYEAPGFKYRELDLDGELITELTSELVDAKGSRDGIPKTLFPLHSDGLVNYRFTLLGEENISGRQTWKVRFEPAARPDCVNLDGDNCPSWKGEAWIDAEELQPVRISTELALKVPLAVRTLLGTNLRQTGFSVTYQRAAPNVWFPATYGTEFKLDVLFFYKRTIALSMDSFDFRRAAATTRIEYGDIVQ